MRFSRLSLWRMPSSGMWRRVILVWTDVSEESIASIFRVQKSARRNQREQLAGVCSHLLTLVPRSRIFLPWRWKRYVPSKLRFTQCLHAATSQKTAFFIIRLDFLPGELVSCQNYFSTTQCLVEKYWENTLYTTIDLLSHLSKSHLDWIVTCRNFSVFEEATAY
jgi:hypothetical protein